MQKVLTIRVDEENYDFVREFSKAKAEEKSRIIRKLIESGRIFLAIEQYKEGKASLNKAAEISGLCLSEFIDVLTEFGIESNLTLEDFEEGLKNLA